MNGLQIQKTFMIQVLEMAFGSGRVPTDPVSSVGEIWHSDVVINPDLYHGIVFLSGAQISRGVITRELGGTKIY